MVEHRLVRRQPHSSQTYPRPLATDVCTFDNHGSTLFEGWTLNNLRFWVESLVISYEIMTVQPIECHFNKNRIASECNKISSFRLYKSVYSNSISRNSPSQRFFAPPQKKTSKNPVQLVLHSFLRLQFHLQMSGNLAENLINSQATCTASKFRRDPDSMEEHCTMAQHISEEGLVFTHSSTWIHYQAAHLQHLSFQPWCLESSRLGGYSVCTSWETPKVFNRIEKLSQSASNKYCLTIVTKLGVFPPPTSSLFLFFRDANLPASESVRSSAQSAPRTNPCLVFPSVQCWFTSSLFWVTNAGLESRNSTHQKINMEPKNEDLEDDFPFERGDFQVQC